MAPSWPGRQPRPRTTSSATPSGERREHCRSPVIGWRTWQISSSSEAPASTTSRTSPSTCPRDSLIVFTGLSGSGKSSLAFDTIFAEGQRRYVESLSAYARQFLGQMDKPDVDFIEGLSPAVSIDQKSTSKNPRSTVGTITEVYDYLRLLYARAGRPHCPTCGAPIERQTPAADRRPGPGPRGGRPVPGAGAGDPRPQGRVRRAVQAAADPGLLPGPGRRRDLLPRRARRRSTSSASTPSRWSSTGSASRRPPSAGSPTRSRPPSTSPAGWCCSTSSTSTPRTPAASSGSPSGCRAPTTTRSTPTSSSRGRSRSTRRSAPAPSATASAPAWRSTPSWSSPTRQATLGEGAIQPWSQAHVADYFLKLMDALGKELGFDLNTPWEDIPRQGPEVAALRPPEQGPRRLAQPLRARARLLRRVRGRAALHRAPPPRGRVRRQPRAVRGLHARGAVPGLRAAAGSSRCRWPSPWATRTAAARTSPRSAPSRSTSAPTTSAPSS